jgi:hypothetical protein
MKKYRYANSGLENTVLLDGKRAVYRFIVSCILLLISCLSSTASLVIIVYNDNALYVGSDSLVSVQGDTNSYKTNKIFELNHSCCVSITGFFGTDFRRENTGEIVESVRLPDDLERLCKLMSENNEPLQSNITSIATQLSAIYDSCIKKLKSTGNDTKDNSTRVLFAGYDNAKKDFFEVSCAFGETNKGTLEIVLERGATNSGDVIHFQGEGNFLKALYLSKDEKFTRLRTPDYDDSMRAVLSEAPIPERRMIHILLTLFQLHKANAAALGCDKGLIGEPYVFYKISKEGVKRLKIEN